MTPVSGVETLGSDSDKRQQQIVDVLVAAFEELIEYDPRVFLRKFRKMARDPFSFYRGSACVFYADVSQLEDRFANERTGAVWIQGDLHAENYGTYMSADGVLVFDVNDFDEAYLGRFTWDLQRMAASLSLLGFAKALSDQTVREAIETYASTIPEGKRQQSVSYTVKDIVGEPASASAALACRPTTC